MRDNVNTALIGRRVQLVPYRREHIATYHGWMQDETLLQLTCSEPLTLEEETANQRSWQDDPTKLTFIVCALDGGTKEGGLHDLTMGMCGDVNAFFGPADDNEEDDAGGDSSSNNGSGASDGDPKEGAMGRICAEIDVMIAKPEYRRRGLAREAVLLLVHYLLEHAARVQYLVVKINDDNTPSLRLFSSLGFAHHKHLAVFGQTELRMALPLARAASLDHWRAIGARCVMIIKEPCAVAVDARPAALPGHGVAAVAPQTVSRWWHRAAVISVAAAVVAMAVRLVAPSGGRLPSVG